MYLIRLHVRLLWVSLLGCTITWSFHSDAFGQGIPPNPQVGNNTNSVDFIGDVHKSIIERAFSKLPPEFHWFMIAIRSHFILGDTIPCLQYQLPTLDKSDFDWPDLASWPLKYDPLDHFDNGYIAESWIRVHERLIAFRNNPADVEDFARAAHGIADFYAHSSYAHFAPKIRSDNKVYLKPFNPTLPIEFVIDYSTDSFNLNSEAFSTNNTLYSGKKSEIPNIWNGLIISGRYSQPNDSKGCFEWLSETLQPIGESEIEFSLRGSLPHHNEIAVDRNNPPNACPPLGNLLYRNLKEYWKQLALRENTAVLHIQLAFYENYTGSDKELLKEWWDDIVNKYPILNR